MDTTRRQRRLPVGTGKLSAAPSSENLDPSTSLIPVAVAARSSCGPQATSPGSRRRSSVGQLQGPGVPGALDPVPEHPQNRTGFSRCTVAVAPVRRALSALQADLGIPLVDGQELTVSRFPHGVMRQVC